MPYSSPASKSTYWFDHLLDEEPLHWTVAAMATTPSPIDDYLDALMIGLLGREPTPDEAFTFIIGSYSARVMPRLLAMSEPPRDELSIPISEIRAKTIKIAGYRRAVSARERWTEKQNQ